MPDNSQWEGLTKDQLQEVQADLQELRGSVGYKLLVERLEALKSRDQRSLVSEDSPQRMWRLQGQVMARQEHIDMVSDMLRELHEYLGETVHG